MEVKIGSGRGFQAGNRESHLETNLTKPGDRVSLTVAGIILMLRAAERLRPTRDHGWPPAGS